ncbi:hypothetical protein LTR27_007878 [Elasticomyces elasticus]|nr:hypothetical protein LTR27_007878 [Elasticomyces elasticus]
MAVDRTTSIEALTLQGAGLQDLRWDDVEFATILGDTVMTMTGCLLGGTPPTSLDQEYIDSQLYLSHGCLEQQDAHGVKHKRRHEHSASDPASNVHASPSCALLGDVQVDRKDDVRLETLVSTTTSGTLPVPRYSLLRSVGHAGDDFHVPMRQAVSSTQAIKAKRTQQNREAALHPGFPSQIVAGLSATQQHHDTISGLSCSTAPDSSSKHAEAAAMSGAYEFVVFSDVRGMRTKTAKSRIRKHAMKEIGLTRRRPCTASHKIELDIHQPGDLVGPTQNVRSPQAATGLHRWSHEQTESPRNAMPMPTSIKLDHTAYELLQYFVYYSSGFPNNFTFTINIDGVMRAALQDDHMANCILSAAAARMCYVQNLASSTMRTKGLSCTQHSLALLRGRIEHQNGPCGSLEALVDCVLYLAAAAIYSEDCAAAEVHVKAAVTLTERGGGLRMLKDSRVIVRLLSLDDLIACKHLRRCLIESSYNPPLEDIEGPDTLSLLQGCDGLACSAHALLGRAELPITPSLQAQIQQIQQCDRIRDLLESPHVMGVAQDPHLRHWRTLRCLAVRNELLAMTASNSREEVLRLALITWTLLPPSDVRHFRTAQGIAARLRPLLDCVPTEAWKGIHDLRLWCLMVGFFACNHGSHDRHWYALNIQRTSRQEELSTFRRMGAVAFDIVGFLKRFPVRDWVLSVYTTELAALTCLDEVP